MIELDRTDMLARVLASALDYQSIAQADDEDFEGLGINVADGLVLRKAMRLKMGYAPEPEPEPESDLELDLEPEPEPELTPLQRLTELGVQTWLLEWVALADLPSESMPVVCAAFELLDCDGEELLLLPAKMLQKKLAKSGAGDATVLAKQVLEQRDALTGDDSAAEVNDQPLCEICFLTFFREAARTAYPSLRARILRELPEWHDAYKKDEQRQDQLPELPVGGDRARE